MNDWVFGFVVGIGFLIFGFVLGIIKGHRDEIKDFKNNYKKTSDMLDKLTRIDNDTEK